MNTSALAFGIVFGAAVAAACSSEGDLDGLARGPNGPIASGEPGTPPPSDVRDPTSEEHPDPLASFPKGKEQLERLCARGDDNKVTQALCSGPSITSIAELQERLGLAFQNRTPTGQNGRNGNPGFALLGHSSSLVAQSVSAINPRAFVFNAPPGRPERVPGYVVMGFVRGEPFVEIAAENPRTRKLSFYLLRFEPECEAAHACTHGDLLTPAIEKDWKGFSLYDDEDLKNTILDCRHCHQPNKDFEPGLRMQELRDPWTHWFRNDRPGGVALYVDYLRVHGEDEDYGGIPGAIIQKADPRALEDLVVGAGFGGQPNSFNSRRIEEEVRRSSSEQPIVNVPAGRSQTWEALYEASFEGAAIPPPYHDVKVTDPDKLVFASNMYVDVKEGRRPASELPDIRKVFLEEAFEAMSFRTRSVGVNGKDVIVQACAQCHNPRLDQDISRAKFDVSRLDQMNRAEKDRAIARMLMKRSDIGHMPPAMMRTLSPEALKLAIDELSK
jgi:hypothetical protein